MSVFVNTNIASLNNQFHLQTVTDRINSSFEKLSSGSRINSASDDAAGLQLSDRLTIQIVGLTQANRNANDGISIAQIAEGALSEVTSNLQQISALAIQGGNRTLSADDRAALGEEFESLLNTNNDIADYTSFGTFNLLDGTAPSSGFQIQTGADSGSVDTVTTGNAKLGALFGLFAAELDIGSLTISGGGTLSTDIQSAGAFGQLVGAYMVNNDVSNVSDALDALILERGTHSGLTFSDMGVGMGNSITINISNLATVLTNSVANSTGVTSSEFADALSALGVSSGDYGTLSGVWEDSQLNLVYGAVTDGLLDTMTGLAAQVSLQRGQLGAEQNGLSSIVRANSIGLINVSDARSRISDTDFASEVTELTRNQIIQQVSVAVLAQANQQPNLALSLLS